MFSFSTHVSQAYVTTGLTNVWYIRRLKKVTGDKSLCYEDDPVTERKHGVGGGKLHNLKSCSSKNLL